MCFYVTFSVVSLVSAKVAPNVPMPAAVGDCVALIRQAKIKNLRKRNAKTQNNNANCRLTCVMPCF